MVHDHDVLVSTAGTDREATRVVSIKFTDGQDLEKELVGSDLGQRLLRWNGLGRIWWAVSRGLMLGRPYALKFWDEVPYDGGLGGREIFGCVGEGEAWPRWAVDMVQTNMSPSTSFSGKYWKQFLLCWNRTNSWCRSHMYILTCFTSLYVVLKIGLITIT